MSFKKRVLSVILAGVLALGFLTAGALAADFTRIRTYTPGQFIDVAENAWYAASVRDAYELGLMSGTGDNTFSPAGMFTLSQALTVAGRMHSIYSGGDGNIPSVTGDWQKDALSYCVQNGIVRKGQFDDYFRNATRAEMAQIMEAALPDSAWSAINSVKELPDVSSSTDGYQAIFKLYNAGVFGGSDEYGMFQPYASITRAEVAAIVSRCAQPAQRLKLNLKPLSEREAPAIPGDLTYSAYKVSNGLMRFHDKESDLYGYIDGTGAVKIPAQYGNAGDFSRGFAPVRGKESHTWGLINTNGETVIANTCSGMEDVGYGVFSANMDGKKGIVVNGVLKSEYSYYSINTNGVYIFGGFYDGSGEVYDMMGNRLGSYNAGIEYKEGCPLLSYKSGNKRALAVGRGEVTEYLYDGIELYENSELALIKSGSMTALAGENGIIFDLGEHEYVDIDGGYALIVDDAADSFTITDAAGRMSDAFPRVYNGVNIRDSSDNGVVILDSLGGIQYVIDVNTGKVYTSVAGSDRFAGLEDGTYYIPDGTKCTDLEDRSLKDYWWRDAYCTYAVDGKYGCSFKGDAVVEPIYDTADEAIASFNFYTIERENGKPVVVYGNEPVGFNEYAIRYYKSSIYYDETLDVGEGYYACRFDRTWYLLHV